MTLVSESILAAALYPTPKDNLAEHPPPEEGECSILLCFQFWVGSSYAVLR